MQIIIEDNKCMKMDNHKIVISRNVRFHEEEFPELSYDTQTQNTSLFFPLEHSLTSNTSVSSTETTRQ